MPNVKNNIIIVIQKKPKIGIVKKQDTLENQANYAYLALGSNLGSKINNLEYAKYKLFKIGVKIIKSSNYYHTKSWPNINFPDFINSVLLIKTDLILKDLFNQIKLIEESLGRKKAIEIISKHRLIELYLVKEMNFKIDEVHDIAEEIEHIENSEFFEMFQNILKTFAKFC